MLGAGGLEFATPQMLAAWGQTELLKKHLEAHPEDVNAAGDWGTCLQQAALHGRVDTVTMLLEAGADINQTEGGDKVPGGGLTALDKALAKDRWGARVDPEEAQAVAQLLRKRGGKTAAELETR